MLFVPDGVRDLARHDRAMRVVRIDPRALSTGSPYRLSQMALGR